MSRSKVERVNGGVCLVCGAQRPPGRGRYCTDQCLTLARSRREQDRQSRRRVACKRCGADKPAGVQGGKYCDECRRMIGDTSAQLEYERSRRRACQRLADRLENGPPVRRRMIDAPEGHKWCARCQAFLPVSSFSAGSGGKIAAYCKPCQRFYNSERRIKLMFGLTWEEYDFLLMCQDGRCAICEGRPRKYLLAVDHDHKTGEIRGLLCSRCNHRLLGAANDSPARLRRAAAYLEEFAPREVFGEVKIVPGFSKQEA